LDQTGGGLYFTLNSIKFYRFELIADPFIYAGPRTGPIKKGTQTNKKTDRSKQRATHSIGLVEVLFQPVG